LRTRWRSAWYSGPDDGGIGRAEKQDDVPRIERCRVNPDHDLIRRPFGHERLVEEHVQRTIGGDLRSELKALFVPFGQSVSREATPILARCHAGAFTKRSCEVCLRRKV